MNPDTLTAPLILIVDDAAELLEAWQLLLENAGFRVITAEHGMMGLDMARRCLPSLIITDLMMPRMDGLTLCRHLKADVTLRGIPVILRTAAMVTVEPVYDRFLRKPVFLDTLLTEIRQLLPGRFDAPP